MSDTGNEAVRKFLERYSVELDERYCEQAARWLSQEVFDFTEDTA